MSSTGPNLSLSDRCILFIRSSLQLFSVTHLFFSTSVEKITLCFVEVSSLFNVPLMKQTESANTGGDKNPVGRGNRWVGNAEVHIKTKVRR